jgi:glycine reductase
MAKELERAGIPTALIFSLVTIVQNVVATRIVAGLGIPHPLGDPRLSLEEQKKARRVLVERALTALASPIPDQKLFH